VSLDLGAIVHADSDLLSLHVFPSLVPVALNISRLNLVSERNCPPLSSEFAQQESFLEGRRGTLGDRSCNRMPAFKFAPKKLVGSYSHRSLEPLILYLHAGRLQSSLRPSTTSHRHDHRSCRKQHHRELYEPSPCQPSALTAT
jgi:hypothetical protein